MRLTPLLRNGRGTRALVFCALCGASATGYAQAPPAVALPSGINTGGTSFFDGFSGVETGWSYLATVRHATADAIRDNDGARVPVFDRPRIRATLWLNQFGYRSDVRFGGASLGLNVIVPMVRLDGSFGPRGAALAGGGTALGDVTVGPVLQFDPVPGPTGHPLFVHRIELDVLLPTGGYHRDRDLNQGSGYYSFNPNWAGTLFPAPGWELSWRANWLYNFRNHRPAAGAPTAFLGQPVASTQAGQAGWLNFAASYTVMPKLHVGVNGYYLRQVGDDKVNRQTLAGSRERVLGLGPGLIYEIDRANGKRDAFWLNVYRESKVENRASNKLILQARFVYTL